MASKTPAKNQLSMSNFDPSDPKIQALGMQMLNSGQVSPEEVQTAQQASQDPQGTQNWLTSFLDKSKAPQPFDFSSQASQPQPANAPAPMSTPMASPMMPAPSSMGPASLPSAKGLVTGKWRRPSKQRSLRIRAKCPPLATPLTLLIKSWRRVRVLRICHF